MGNIKARLKKLEQASGRDSDKWLKQASPEELEAEIKKLLQLP